MAETYLALVNAKVTQRATVVVGDGSASAGLIPALNASGKLDATLLGLAANEFVFTQASPLAQWAITHNLGFHPSVTVVDSSGRLVEGDVSYVNANQVTLNFSSGFAGTAYLS